jgi:DNA polymerase elongation subunit (family B)
MKIEPVEYKLREMKKRLCTFDTETDPFARRRVVKPFTCGFYIADTGAYYDFWGSDCIDQFFKFLDTEMKGEELVIYAHNGGNFDFHFMTEHFDAGTKPFIIDGRLVQLYMHGFEFRDSYSAVPVALEEYKKTKTDYATFERDVREEHKEEIRRYQRDDCVFLAELIQSWLERFGDRFTMASVALPWLEHYHGFEKLNQDNDKLFRQYYYGGRVSCLENGVLEDDWKLYDVTSMYPHVMSAYKHPVSKIPIRTEGIEHDTCFAWVNASSKGVLPVRTDAGIDFPDTTGDFFACIHEIRAGQETGHLVIHAVHAAYSFRERVSFTEFVDEFFNKRLEAKRLYKLTGEDRWKIEDIFMKLVLNSAYGKFAQDPRRYDNYLFDPLEPPIPRLCQVCTGQDVGTCTDCAEGWTSPTGWREYAKNGKRIIYARPRALHSRSLRFFNVATAASITSAARAELWRAIASADRPIYCDTDSLICRDLRSSNIHPSKLGAWKLEGTGRVAAIAGKKLYALFDDEGDPVLKDNGRPVMASKGARLSPGEIRYLAEDPGNEIQYEQEAPKFKLTGDAQFTHRTIRMTAEGAEEQPEEFTLQRVLLD